MASIMVSSIVVLILLALLAAWMQEIAKKLDEHPSYKTMFNISSLFLIVIMWGIVLLDAGYLVWKIIQSF